MNTFTRGTVVPLKAAVRVMSSSMMFCSGMEKDGGHERTRVDYKGRCFVHVFGHYLVNWTPEKEKRSELKIYI